MRKPQYKGRRRPSEEGKPRILVLCEATDPERSYFNALKADFGLTSVRVQSAPCFEYWILLHFTFTTKTYRGTGDMSACKQVRRELRNHIADYKKTDRSIYRRCRERLDTAIKHGRRVPVTRDALSGTDVGRLIERLKRL